MEAIRAEALLKQLEQLVSQQVYIHLEVNPGAYWRNGRARLTAVHVKGSGPYRIFLEMSDDSGLIQVDSLTHMQLGDGLVIATGYDDHQRIARTVEISTSPFSM